MIRKIFIFMVAALLSAGLSACLFEKDERTFTYTAELNGRIRAVYVYNADGGIQRSLGIGIEQKESSLEWFGEDSGSLTLWPVYFFTTLDGTPFINDSAFSDSYFMADPAISPFFARVTRDSTSMMRVDAGILLPQLIVDETRGGFPCSFSHLRAFQVEAGGTDTIPVKVSGKHFDRADTVRFALIIDTAASRAADARVDFTRRVTGRVDVTCPEP